MNYPSKIQSDILDYLFKVFFLFIFLNTSEICIYLLIRAVKYNSTQLTIFHIYVNIVSLQPLFGASLHIFKVEIGGDSQSSGQCAYSTVEIAVIFVISI